MDIPNGGIYSPATTNKIAIGARLKVEKENLPLGGEDAINFSYLKHVEQPDIIFKEILKNG